MAQEHKEIPSSHRSSLRVIISTLCKANHIEESNKPSDQREQNDDENSVVRLRDPVEDDDEAQAHGEDRAEQAEPADVAAERREPGEPDDEPDAEGRKRDETEYLCEEADFVVVVDAAALGLVLVVGQRGLAVGLGLLLVLLVVWSLSTCALRLAWGGLCDNRAVGNDAIANLGVRHFFFFSFFFK